MTSPAGGTDPMFVVRYDTLGNYITGMVMATGGDDFLRIMVDNNGSFFLAGDYVPTTTFGPDVLIPTGIENLFVAKYRYDSGSCFSFHSLDTKQEQQAMGAGIELYPNPCSEEFSLASGVPFAAGSEVGLYDISGRLVFTQPLLGNTNTFSTQNLAPGLYQCRIQRAGGDIVVKKLVVIK
jgi:hypothetical protein